MKPDVHSGQYPVTPHARVVDLVNETRVLIQACFCLRSYPPRSDGNLFEVLEWKRYHSGVLDKPTNFQGDGENL